ncbi:hypothetical protein FO519_009988 [Halicephalobus sp. NKZ332]|nr:hypothetical protein FO519_009988 [Halicephalobus sp. NKZ332]
MITGNIAGNFLDNPFFKTFITKLRPSYKLPPRNSKYANTLVPAEFDRVQLAVKKATNETDFLSMSSDGWTDVNGSRLINIIVHTPKPYLFNSINATSDAHDGVFICKVLSSEIEKLGPQKIVALVTDNAPNMKAAWKLINQSYPWIVCEGCKAHGVDLAAKDLCKLDFVSEIVNKCIEVAKFFRKTVPKLVLEELQRSTVGRSHVIPLPSNTRWSSTWRLLESIKKNESCLKSCIWLPKIVDDKELRKNMNRLTELRQILCEDRHFWKQLSLIEELLHPFKTAISSIEGSVVDVRKSYKIVETSFDKANEIATKFSADEMEEITEILDNRRDFCRSDLVHLLELLDPTERGQNLSAEEDEIAMMLLTNKILRNPVFAGRESQALVEIAQFKSKTGVFESRHWAWKAVENGRLEAVSFWPGFFSDTVLSTVFKSLQMIPVTSAASERNWSIRGAIHTDVRNRLAVETTSKLTYIKHNLILEHCDLFKIDRQRNAKEPNEEVFVEDDDDEIIIDDF